PPGPPPPPTAPRRDAIVMPREPCRGGEKNFCEEPPPQPNQPILPPPVPSPAKWRPIMPRARRGFDRHFIDLNYDESMGLEAAVRNIADQAEEAVRGG
ncbi:glutamate synthase central domain-containing protein, partial [Pseudomonas aeruginosa]|uniref:glutamate synthase central domain-containing protein n=1 Tax=Pseudomonas aeruginosa TaxID=287 RepID=UPI002665D7A7